MYIQDPEPSELRLFAFGADRLIRLREALELCTRHSCNDFFLSSSFSGAEPKLIAYGRV